MSWEDVTRNISRAFAPPIEGDPMLEEPKQRVLQVRNYLVDHAPQIATTVAVVGILSVLIRQTQNQVIVFDAIRDEIAFQDIFQKAQIQAIEEGIATGAKFRHYPGVGVRFFADRAA